MLCSVQIRAMCCSALSFWLSSVETCAHTRTAMSISIAIDATIYTTLQMAISSHFLYVRTSKQLKFIQMWCYTRTRTHTHAAKSMAKNSTKFLFLFARCSFILTLSMHRKYQLYVFTILRVTAEQFQRHAAIFMHSTSAICVSRVRCEWVLCVCLYLSIFCCCCFLVLHLLSHKHKFQIKWRPLLRMATGFSWLRERQGWEQVQQLEPLEVVCLPLF